MTQPIEYDETTGEPTLFVAADGGITFVGSHACQRMEKKRWYEYVSEPWQSWKCNSEFVPMDTFKDRQLLEDLNAMIDRSEQELEKLNRRIAAG